MEVSGFCCGMVGGGGVLIVSGDCVCVVFVVWMVGGVRDVLVVVFVH